MKKKLSYVLLLLVWGFSLPEVIAQAQSSEAKSKDDIEYDALTDDPYDLNKMWLHFYPVIADGFVTNMNAGFGAQGNFMYKNKFDFRLQGRKAYFKGSDLSRGIGEKVSQVSNKLNSYTYIDGGATYHVVDKDEPGEAKMIVYTKRYSAGKWASTVPEFIMVPAKVRKIIGVRAGGMYWHSATNIGHVLRKQGLFLDNADKTSQLTPFVKDAEGKNIEQRIYSNVTSGAFYLGGSMSRIRNVAIKPKKYDAAINDMIFTGYADIIYSPSITVEDIRKDGISYLAAPIKTSPLGFRLGMEGMYNREFSWSYGAELGVRPSIKGRSAYVMIKVGFALASRLNQQRQAYQKEK